jgi:arylsulfatase A-like enzyme
MYGLAAGSRSPKVLRADAAEGLPLAEVTLAELLKGRGYATGIIGKWHLGSLPAFLPMAQGFDSWFGLPYSHDMNMRPEYATGRGGAANPRFYDPKPEYWDVALMRNEQVIERPVDHRTLTSRYTDEAVRFIEANRGRPFFLYLAHSLPHVPLARSAPFVGHSPGGIYGDVVEEIDASTGRIVDALRKAGLDRRTLVIFTSDNGPWLPFGTHGGSAGPLSNGKGTTWEGGVRTPAIFWWPGTITPGVVTDMGSAMDIYPTVAALAGATVPADRPIDGVDLRPVLTRLAPSPRHLNFYYWDDELRAIRKDRYKAHFITSGAYSAFGERKVHDPPVLFDLAVDPGERFDVAAAHPDVVADLVREADAHRTAMIVGKPLFDVLIPPR